MSHTVTVPNQTSVPIAVSEDTLAYTEPRADLPAPALQRLGPDGDVIWSVPPPEAQDSWVSASIEGETVTAHSWSCWRVQLDLGTGQEIARTFTK